MKKGAGDDPFADEPEPESAAEGQTNDEENVESSSGQVTVTETPPGATGDEQPSPGDDLPYLARRSLKGRSVKADRDQVPFFLRETVQEGERTLRRAVEDDLGQEVNKTDLREAAYVYAQRNPDGVAEILREWGVEYLE